MFRKFPHGMSCWAAIPCGIEWGAIDLERVRRLKGAIQRIAPGLAFRV